MKLIFSSILLFFVAGSSCLAWGVTGHRAVGWIAESYLNAAAKKRVAAILGQESIAIAGTWMDEIRSDTLYGYVTSWHYTTIPDGKRYEDVEGKPDGKLIMMAEKIIADLKAGKLPPAKEKEMLKMLIHMIADIHQPLHIGKEGDRGGNDIRVKWFGRDSNLHRVWDGDMIDESRLSYTELAQSLGRPDAATLTSWQQSTIRSWAAESMTYRDKVYAIGNGQLGYPYSYRNFPIVKTRLLQAGVRLAALLNQIYGE